MRKGTKLSVHTFPSGNFIYLCKIMGNISTYRVAGFCFTLEGLPVETTNLRPFRVQEPADEPIFSLKIVRHLPDVTPQPLYTTPEQPGFPVISIATVQDGFLVRMQPLPQQPIAGELLVDADFRRAQLLPGGTEDRFAVDNALMLLFTFATARLGALEMHSSVVVKEGRGFLFLGKSGTGKSTHSRLWLENIPGTELLNDDNPIIRLLPDGSARVYGSPWSGKTPCFKAMDASIGAIVMLSQAQENRIERLGPLQAYAALMESVSSFRPLKHLADSWHDTMEGIISAVPFYHLYCLPDAAAAQLCHTTVNG
jgi:hypothetical protein